ncbi:MAG: glycosyltransferase family 39 protein [Nitrospirae bacterium]|nr:glycosyltransferase family 39 protein [Nitrospirota bacterium]
MGLRLKIEKISFAAALFSCFYFGLYQEPAHILSESVFTFLFTLSIYLLLKTDKNPFYFPSAGALIGITAFTRPVGLLLIPAVLLWITVKFYRNNFIKHSLFLIFGFCAVLTPWWLRNYKTFGTFVPVCLETGFVMRHAHSSEEQIKKLSEFDKLPELERDRKNFSAGLEYFKSHSMPQLLRRWTRNFLQFLYPFMPAYDFTYALIFPLWLYGIYVILKTKDTNSYLLLSMFIYFPVSAFFFGTARYRHSMGAFFILISFFGINYILSSETENLKKKKFMFIGGGIWMVLNALVLYWQENIRLVVKAFFSGL